MPFWKKILGGRRESGRVDYYKEGLDLMKEELLRRLNEGREEGRVEKLVLVLAGE